MGDDNWILLPREQQSDNLALMAGQEEDDAEEKGQWRCWRCYIGAGRMGGWEEGCCPLGTMLAARLSWRQRAPHTRLKMILPPAPACQHTTFISHTKTCYVAHALTLYYVTNVHRGDTVNDVSYLCAVLYWPSQDGWGGAGAGMQSDAQRNTHEAVVTKPA